MLQALEATAVDGSLMSSMPWDRKTVLCIIQRLGCEVHDGKVRCFRARGLPTVKPTAGREADDPRGRWPEWPVAAREADGRETDGRVVLIDPPDVVAW